MAFSDDADKRRPCCLLLLGIHSRRSYGPTVTRRLSVSNFAFPYRVTGRTGKDLAFSLFSGILSPSPPKSYFLFRENVFPDTQENVENVWRFGRENISLHRWQTVRPENPVISIGNVRWCCSAVVEVTSSGVSSTLLWSLLYLKISPVCWSIVHWYFRTNHSFVPRAIATFSILDNHGRYGGIRGGVREQIIPSPSLSLMPEWCPVSSEVCWKEERTLFEKSSKISNIKDV